LVAFAKVDPSFLQWMRASYPKSLVLPSTLDFSTEVVSVQALHVSFVFKKYPFAHTIRDTALSFAI